MSAEPESKAEGRLREIEQHLAHMRGRNYHERLASVESRVHRIEQKVTWWTGASAGLGAAIGAMASILTLQVVM